MVRSLEQGRRLRGSRGRKRSGFLESIIMLPQWLVLSKWIPTKIRVVRVLGWGWELEFSFCFYRSPLAQRSGRSGQSRHRWFNPVRMQIHIISFTVMLPQRLLWWLARWKMGILNLLPSEFAGTTVTSVEQTCCLGFSTATTQIWALRFEQGSSYNTYLDGHKTDCKSFAAMIGVKHVPTYPVRKYGILILLPPRRTRFCFHEKEFKFALDTRHINACPVSN